MVNRFLSMDKDLLPLVNYFQKYSIGLLEPKEIYRWYCDIVPKGKKWNKYIKPTKAEKYKSDIVDIVKKHYNLSTKECHGYLKIFNKTKEGKQELKEIIAMYGNE